MKQVFLDKIKRLPKFGRGICLQRVDTAIDGVKPAPVIYKTHRKLFVTGTNGKGSVAFLLYDILSEVGLNCALFTSPHFFEFNERFRYSGKNVPYDTLNTAFDQIHTQIQRIEHENRETFGVFEVLFLLAIKAYKSLGADFLVFEAGIGGRYDPVRLMQSHLTALTSVDLEHREILGDSKELIAYDKLDACVSGGTTVVGNIDQTLKQKVDSILSAQECQNSF